MQNWTKLALVIVWALALQTPSAHASEEHVVVLKKGHLVVDGEKHRVATIKSTIGDVLHIFHSDPEFSHDFYVSDGKYALKSGKISVHGDHHDITLDHGGQFEILCTQMPDMKVTVIVSE